MKISWKLDKKLDLSHVSHDHKADFFSFERNKVFDDLFPVSHPKLIVLKRFDLIIYILRERLAHCSYYQNKLLLHYIQKIQKNKKTLIFFSLSSQGFDFCFFVLFCCYVLQVSGAFWMITDLMIVLLAFWVLIVMVGVFSSCDKSEDLNQNWIQCLQME